MGALDFLDNREQTHNAVSPLKDPFSRGNIEMISIHIFSHSYGKPVRCTVSFQNGNTKGEQKFEGDDLAKTMTEVQAFIDGLER